MLKLFSKQRLGETVCPPDSGERSAFERDHDRIVYSNYFRRLHDKTQVFPYAPLSASSQARSRLSHSLEVSCVARSLGIITGSFLTKKIPGIQPYDIAMIVASASLGHDIGNPPFGHSGEDAIRNWAINNLTGADITKEELLDFTSFEGNAQGFRILSRLEIWQRKGSIRPAAATIGAFSKYPCSSADSRPASNEIARKKFGFFREDEQLFCEAFSAMGLKPLEGTRAAFPRHPLAFLSEAADDICYAVIDLEDAFHIGIIDYHTVEELLLPIAQNDPDFEMNNSFDDDIKIARLRSASINSMTGQVAAVFQERFDEIMNFSYNKSLIDEIQNAQEYRIIYDFSMQNIYSARRVLEIEYAGFKAIGGLLDIFVPAILSSRPDKEEKLGRKLIPDVYLKRHEFSSSYRKNENSEDLIARLTKYQSILSVTDYICGMTDRFAIDLFQKLRGIHF